MNQEMAETWTLNVVCSLKARLDMIYSSDRFIPLIHWYVSANHCGYQDGKINIILNFVNLNGKGKLETKLR